MRGVKSFIFVTLCLLFVGSSAIAKEVTEVECYPSRQTARVHHPTEHLRHKQLHDGVCWHIGRYQPNSIITRIGQEKTVLGSSLTKDSPKKILHLKDWSKAKPLTPTEFYSYKWSTWEWASPW